ncbi:unnamed protein product, partial [Rotaria sp. Silwood2]
GGGSCCGGIVTVCCCCCCKSNCFSFCNFSIASYFCKISLIFSSRHMAAARFQRNQRLLCEIFNEVCIPDLRSNINVDRILT